MSAHDRYLAGYSSMPVVAHCGDCGFQFDAVEQREYGTSWLEPEECPRCGEYENLRTEPMDEQDIQERRLEARGEDF